MRTRHTFRRWANALLVAGTLAFLFAVLQPHHHDHGAGSQAQHSCVVWKVNDRVGGVPVIAVVLHPCTFSKPPGLLMQFESAHTEFILTSAPPTAPPHYA